MTGASIKLAPETSDIALSWLVVVGLMVSSLLVLNFDLGDSPDTEEGNDAQGGHVLTLSSGGFFVSANWTTPAYVGEVVTFWVSAESDDPAADLTFTIYYDYYLPGMEVNPASPVSVDVTGNPGSIVTTFVYDHLGNLTVGDWTYFIARCVVTDGVSTPISFTRVAYVVENRSPYFSLQLPPAIYVDKGVPMDFATQVQDPDGDSVFVTWEWGDGTANATNVTGPSAAGVWCNQTHTWDPAVMPGTGDFDIYTTLNITLDDGAGNVVLTQYDVYIYVPLNFGPSITLDWWPYLAKVDSVVQFNGTAVDVEGEDLTWVFDFGDGSPIEVYHTAGVANEIVWLNVTHVFLSAGTFNGVVNVSDVPIVNPGFPHNVSSSFTVLVMADEPPAASEHIGIIPSAILVLNSTTGVAAAQFYIEVIDINGDVVTCVWSFGDGSPEVVNQTSGGLSVFEFEVCHDFQSAGFFNVTANITDGTPGNEIQRYLVVEVRYLNAAPVADAGEDQAVSVGEQVTFDAGDSYDDLGIVDYNWTLTIWNGEGYDSVYLHGEVVTYTFMFAGIYGVLLIVTDVYGLVDSDVVEIVVTDPIPEFGEVVLPVCGTLMLMVALVTIRRRNPTRPR